LPSSHSIARRSAAPGALTKEKTTKDAIGTDGARIAKQREATHKATAFKLDPKCRSHSQQRSNRSAFLNASP